MEVIWSADADADLDGILDYIADDNIDAALNFREKLLTAADSLRRFPLRGRLGAIEGTRELVVSHRYILVYEVEANNIVIQAVINTYQLWPPQK